MRITTKFLVCTILIISFTGVVNAATMDDMMTINDESYIPLFPGRMGEISAITDQENPDIIQMWVYNNTRRAVDYGISSNGINYTFTPTNLPAGTVVCLHVLKHDGYYYLYGAVSDLSYIATYRSDDGINFIKEGIALTPNPGGWDSRAVANSFVWVENSTWYMIYEAMNNGVWNVGLATSDRSTGFTRVINSPVISTPGVGNPELLRKDSEVTKINGKYYLYYHIYQNSVDFVERAYSTDLINWVHEGVVTYPHGNLPGWTYGDPAMVVFKGKTYLFYGSGDQTQCGWANLAIGYKSPFDTIQPTPTITTLPTTMPTSITTTATTIPTTIPTILPTATPTKTNCAKGTCKTVKPPATIFALIFEFVGV